MASFRVSGAEDFYRLSKALKAAGRTDLRKDLNKSMRDAAKPMIPRARLAAASRLPQSGGLAQRVASAPMRVQTRTGAHPGVRVVVGRKPGIAARATNRGTVRHPVFGNRDVWVSQRVPARWFDDAMQSGAPLARHDLKKALKGVAERIAREVG